MTSSKIIARQALTIILTCERNKGTFSTLSSAPFDGFTENSDVLDSQSPALCCGSRQWTKRSFVLLSVSTWPSTANFVCKQADLRLMAAVPVLKVRRMLEALRRDWVPSRPTIEPLKVEGPKPRIVTNSLLISSLEKRLESVKIVDRAVLLRSDTQKCIQNVCAQRRLFLLTFTKKLGYVFYVTEKYRTNANLCKKSLIHFMSIAFTYLFTQTILHIAKETSIYSSNF